MSLIHDSHDTRPQTADIFYHTCRIWRHKMRFLSFIECTSKRTAFHSHASVHLVCSSFTFLARFSFTRHYHCTAHHPARICSAKAFSISNDAVTPFVFCSSLLSFLRGLISTWKWDFAHSWEDNGGFPASLICYYCEAGYHSLLLLLALIAVNDWFWLTWTHRVRW